MIVSITDFFVLIFLFIHITKAKFSLMSFLSHLEMKNSLFDFYVMVEQPTFSDISSADGLRKFSHPPMTCFIELSRH